MTENKRVIEITDCEQCLFFSGGCDNTPDGEAKEIEDRYSIPDWCPLDTPEEYAESNFNIDKEP